MIRELRPTLVIIDGLFMVEPRSFIQVGFEAVQDCDMWAIPEYPSQQKTVVGTPSQLALEKMAAVLQYQVEWLDWNGVPPARRLGLDDYFQDHRYESDYYQGAPHRRFTCALRPEVVEGPDA